MIFFRALRINFQVLLLVVAFDDISVSILLRQPSFDSVWHFRKSVRNSFVKVWQIEKFTLRRNRKKSSSFFSHVADAENRKKCLEGCL